MLRSGDNRDPSLSRLALEASERYRRHLEACLVDRCLCSQRTTKDLIMCSHFLGWSLSEQGGGDGTLVLASPTAGIQHIRWPSFPSDTVYAAQDADPWLARVIGLSARRM